MAQEKRERTRKATKTSKAFLRDAWGTFALAGFPVPVGPLKRKLAGTHDDDGVLEFYSHPKFIATAHLIWFGWLLTLLTAVNALATNQGWSSTVPESVLAWGSWLWIGLLIITMIVQGIDFNRVAVALFTAAILIVLLALWLVQALSDWEVFRNIWNLLKRIPVLVEWGVPLVTSFILGSVFFCVATWRRLNDRWRIEESGNFLEHHTFERTDRAISKGAKTFVAVWPCLLKKFFFFGYGDIEVRSPDGKRILDHIQGVLFAQRVATLIMERLGTTDVTAVVDDEADDAAAAADADEEAAGEAL